MRGYQLSDFAGIDISIAFTAVLDDELADHLTTEGAQEELTFAYWRPSAGTRRCRDSD